MEPAAKSFIAAVAMVVCLSVPVAAGPFEDAIAAYYRGDYATVLRLLRPLAEQGDAAAQFNLGLIYGNGQGVPQDNVEAVKWYRLSAVQHQAVAQINLGLMYAKGNGVPQDYAEAIKWYRQAAEQSQAVAQHNLGVMYANGEGVPQDYVMAHMWFSLAAVQGDEDATKFRDIMASIMTPPDISEAQRLAREWKPK